MLDATSSSRTATAFLEVQGLSVALRGPRGLVPALDDISLTVAPGRTLALAGESGSGKSLLVLALAGLLPEVAHVASGSVWLDGRSLLTLPPAERRRLAGRDVGIVFQEPMTALNPVLRIGAQLAEVPRLHGHGAAAARAMALAMLGRVQVPDPERVLRAYPHQLSGGLRQRVLIAMALILEPRLMLADEPTTALDVTLQAGILALLQSLQRDRGAAMLIVSHDLAMLAEVADDVAVLYAGRVVEQAEAGALFAQPRHPYTRGLLGARPPLTGARHGPRILPAIEGQVPAPGAWPVGCPFAPRCALVQPRCHAQVPLLQTAMGSHRVACFEAT